MVQRCYQMVPFRKTEKNPKVILCSPNITSCTGYDNLRYNKIALRKSNFAQKNTLENTSLARLLNCKCNEDF